MYLNKVFLYGNLTRDPEARALPSGQQVVSFGIATNRTYKDKAGVQKDMAEYHNIVAFGRTAEVMNQYLKKGRPVFIEGRIQTRSWESEGQKKYRTEIVVDSFQFGADGGRRDGGDAGGRGEERQHEDTSEKSEGISYPEEDINPEDIPF